MAKTLTQTHVNLTLANTEYSVTIPIGATSITIKLRDIGADLKYYFVSGAAEYKTLLAGSAVTLESSKFKELIIYFKCPEAAQVVEIEYAKPDTWAVEYALTTKERVKQKISIATSVSNDELIDRLISGVTDFIECYCNRRFKQQVDISEIQSAEADSQKFFFLKQAPASSLTAYYNSGTVASPTWTAYPAEDYQLDEDGKSGIVRIYGGVGKGTNVVKFVYTAGYLIDFDNEFNSSMHTLPFDISELADRLVIRWYKKREAAGKASESYEGGSVNWRDALDEDDRMTLDSYRRVPFVI